MDQELIAYLDQRFRETSQQIEVFREETTSRLDRVEGRLEGVEGGLEGVKEDVRHTQITLEGMRGEIRIVAEGVMGIDERIMALRAEIARDVKRIDNFVHLSHVEMNDRLRPLESWKEQIGQDPVALVREKFGKKPDPPV
jgi:hypothetical protein